jgi:hypothetical protein
MRPEAYISKNAKLFLCLNNYAVGHKDIWGNRDIAPPFLTSEIYGCKWLASSLSQATSV